MQTTFILWPSIIALAIGAALYWFAVRPHIKDDPNFSAFRGRAISWIKSRWDMAAAGAIAAAPVIWQMSLDGIVAVSNTDLSTLILPDAIKQWVPILAIVAPIIRGAMLKSDRE